MYETTLSPKDRERYNEKIQLCGVDPFKMQAADCIADVNLWPRVDASDICEFLVLRTSFVTRQQLKARKALDGHNFVTSGWVREPRVKQVAADSVIVMTQVTHSQALNKPPVEVWFLGKDDGEILAAHCTCMAGNGEACSHIAALLFYVDYGVRAREERSWTDGPNSWLPPSMRKLDVRPVAEMDLSSSAMKKRRIDAPTSTTCAPQASPRLVHEVPHRHQQIHDPDL
ncbi:uncharacterized protein LOC119384903 [Rhipicephalus sanguineus]|uniref:uncharacterized protein LOC119384903 n=1 Tax=Rhipicephalus sanguineus TaxID=34632 RepID=UPI0020C3681F|nr:uncharacterized protein LOC119384903 [Rhipicephalus sanguineus]